MAQRECGVEYRSELFALSSLRMVSLWRHLRGFRGRFGSLRGGLCGIVC